jgi:aspartate/methionine/tyrosine aminotransferase
VENHISTPIICNGITNAIYITTRLFLEPKEQIICPNKRWGNYNSVLTLQNDLEIVEFEFFRESRLNITGIVNTMHQVGERQRHIPLVLNFPNNPTGYCPTPTELRKLVNQIVQVAEDLQKPIIVFCDDAYEGYAYSDAVVDYSVFYELVNLHPLIIPLKLDGTSKELLMYGARIAAMTLGLHDQWLAASNYQKFTFEWQNKLEGMVRSTISSTNHFSQEMLIELMDGGFQKFLTNRQKVMDILRDRYHATVTAYKKYAIPHTSLDPAGGGFFVFMNIDGISASQFADHLLTRYKIGTFPNENPKSGVNGIRLAYCSVPREQIDRMFAGIARTMEELSD